jgi:hypothetical protein
MESGTDDRHAMPCVWSRVILRDGSRRVRRRRLSLALLTVLVGCTPWAGCGGAESTPGPPSVTSGTDAVPVPGSAAASIHRDSDDGDEDPNQPDDALFVNYGHPASIKEARAITKLVKSYYAAAVSLDGKTMCAQLYDLLVEKVVEEYENTKVAGPSCAAVLVNLFRARQHRLAAALPKLEVTRLRVEGSKSYAFVYLGKLPEPYLMLHRQGSTWKIESVFEIVLP